MQEFYRLEGKTKGVDGVIRLNGLRIRAWNSSEPEVFQQLINSWLVPGENRFSVRVQWPKEVPFTPGQANVSFDLSRASSSSESVDLGQIRFPKLDAPETYPSSQILLFNAPATLPSRLWTEGESIDLNEDTTREIMPLVETLWDALEAKNLEAALSLLDFRMVDIGASHYLNAERSRAGQRMYLESCFTATPWKMENLEPANWRLLLGDNAKIVQILSGDSEFVLRSSREQEPQLLLPICVGKIKGRWTFVR